MFSFFKRMPKPAVTGYLPEQDGHRVFYQAYGNPKGAPVLHFHGGPGGSSKPKHAPRFDLRRHYAVMFDQRGCGQSLPAGETRNNTVRDLVTDAARLLNHLGIDRAAVSGSSWGATLALLFAQTYPQRVEKLVLTQVFLARKKDADWITQDMARLYPDMMAEIMREVPAGMPARQHYAARMATGDDAARSKATSLYGSYEHMIGTLSPAFPQDAPTPEHVQAFGLYMHYDSHGYFLDEDEILQNMRKIAHIPALIVHNRLDLVCPVEQAWLVAKAMTDARLVIVPEAGHVGDKLFAVTKQEIERFIS